MNGTQIIFLDQPESDPTQAIEELKKIVKRYFYLSQYGNYQIYSETPVKGLIVTFPQWKEKTDLFYSKNYWKNRNTKDLKNVWEIKNFAPVRCEGEDYVKCSRICC